MKFLGLIFVSMFVFSMPLCSSEVTNGRLDAVSSEEINTTSTVCSHCSCRPNLISKMIEYGDSFSDKKKQGLWDRVIMIDSIANSVQVGDLPLFTEKVSFFKPTKV